MNWAQTGDAPSGHGMTGYIVDADSTYIPPECTNKLDVNKQVKCKTQWFLAVFIVLVFLCVRPTGAGSVHLQSEGHVSTQSTPETVLLPSRHHLPVSCPSIRAGQLTFQHIHTPWMLCPYLLGHHCVCLQFQNLTCHSEVLLKYFTVVNTTACETPKESFVGKVVLWSVLLSLLWCLTPTFCQATCKVFDQVNFWRVNDGIQVLLRRGGAGGGGASFSDLYWLVSMSGMSPFLWVKINKYKIQLTQAHW